jgi:putative copper export protein
LPESILYEAFPKTLLYMAALAAIGVPVARVLLERAAGHVQPDTTGEIEARLRRLARGAAFFALATLIARAWAYTASAFGPAEAVQWENLRLIVIESRWGAAWRWQAAAGVVLVAAALALTSGRRAWIEYSLAAAALGCTLPLLGHAASSARMAALHAVHILAGGAWIGTLAAIGLGIAPAGGDRHPDGSVLDRVVARFATIALPGASVVILSGLVLALVYIGFNRGLIATGYGQALLVKVGLVAGIAACGGANYVRARRGAITSSALIGAELALAAAAVAATSVLTQLEQP